MIKPIISVFFAAGAASISPALIAAPHAHAHGKGEMEMTVQNGMIRAIFKTPMDSLVGFEHAPTTDAQKQAVAQLKTRLADPARFFAPSAAAQCTAGAAEFSSAMFTGQVSGKHSDLEYRFSFKCANQSALKSLEAVLFADYPRLHEIRVLVVTDKGQRATTLKKKNRSIALY